MPPIYANGISATGDPIHFMFGSRVEFSGTADRTALFTVRTNPRWWPPPCWKNFEWPYLRNSSRSTYIDPTYIRTYIFAIAQLSCSFVWQTVAMILHHTTGLRWKVTHKAWFSRRGWYSCFSRCLPTPPSCNSPALGEPDNFGMKLALEKLEWWGYCIVKISWS